jgi:hypothetical protein
VCDFVGRARNFLSHQTDAIFDCVDLPPKFRAYRIFDHNGTRNFFSIASPFCCYLPMSANLNEVQNASVGAMVGTIEVLMLQPFNYAKNMVQQQQPISMNPLVMYRGVGANCVNMGSCTMIQFAVGGKLKSIVVGEDATRKLKPQEEMLCGMAAGTVSATVGSPLELIMIQQQRKGGSTLATFNSIANPSNFFRGFVGAAVREALWTCGYLSIPPIVRNYLLENHSDTFYQQ